MGAGRFIVASVAFLHHFGGREPIRRFSRIIRVAQALDEDNDCQSPPDGMAASLDMPAKSMLPTRFPIGQHLQSDPRRES